VAREHGLVVHPHGTGDVALVIVFFAADADDVRVVRIVAVVQVVIQDVRADVLGTATEIVIGVRKDIALGKCHCTQQQTEDQSQIQNCDLFHFGILSFVFFEIELE